MDETERIGPMDTSEALLKRFEARRAHRESPEGKRIREAHQLERLERKVTEEEKERKIKTEEEVGRGDWREFADQISELTEATKDTAKFTEQMAKATAMIEELPKEKAVQRRIVIGMLEQIEANELPLTDYRNTVRAGTLRAAIERGLMHPELARECQARLALQHCAAWPVDVPGLPDEQIAHFFNMFQRAETQKYILQGEDLHLLLKERLPDLEVRKAFEELQEAAKKGLEIEVPAKGEKKGGGRTEKKVVKFRGKGFTKTEQDLLEAEIIRMIGGDEKAAKKSLQLASRVAQALFLTSAWNEDLQGKDPLGECIYFKEWREGRGEGARDRGPDISIPRIESVGVIPFTSAIQEKRLKKITQIKDPGERLAELRKIQREEVDIDKLDFLSLEADAYAGHAGISIPRVLIAKQILLKTTWKKDETDSDKVETWSAPIRTADPFEIHNLRVEFTTALLWTIYSRPKAAMQLGWDNFALERLKENLTHPYLSQDTGKQTSFISEEQWKYALWAVKEITRETTGRALNVQAAAIKIGTMMTVAQRMRVVP